MKKKLLFLVVPLMAMIITGCVKYNGQGKNGSKSSKAPESSQPADSSGDVSTDSANPSSDASSNPSSADSSGAPASSSSSAPSSSAAPVTGEDLPVGTQVNVYLVFGEYGKYKGNLVNTGIEEEHLEHTLKLETKVGDDLPGKADVTSSVKGSEFVGWIAYNNDGKLTQYTKVPAVYDKILYASFSGGSGQGGGGSSSSSSPSSGSSGGSSSSSYQPTDEKVAVTIKVVKETSVGQGVYLVGDFCNWNPANFNSIKFEWSEGNVWTASKEIPQGMTYRCKLVVAPYDIPSKVYEWEKTGEGNERVITFNEAGTINLEWGNY